jgi:hypothetical protein
MFNKKNKANDGIFTSILFAHLILILHLVFFAGLGLLVVFLNGMMQYMLWIFLGGMALIALSAYLFYRRLRKEGKSLGETLRSPDFRGRQVEVSLLGGMATLKLDSPNDKKAIEAGTIEPPLQLEDTEMARIREINALARLLEKELITLDEFNSAKQRLLGP